MYIISQKNWIKCDNVSGKRDITNELLEAIEESGERPERSPHYSFGLGKRGGEQTTTPHHWTPLLHHSVIAYCLVQGHILVLQIGVIYKTTIQMF